MRIEELRVSGFRAFANARLTLDDLTVVVGRNGAGKSTIIDAFELLREALTDGVGSALERRGGVQAVAHKGAGVGRGFSIAVKMRLSRDHVEEVAREAGLWSNGLSHDHVAFYGFRVSARRGKGAFVIEDELARCAGGDAETRFEPSGHSAVKDALDLPAQAQHSGRLRAVLEAIRGGFRAYKLSPTAIRTEPPIGPAGVLSRDGGNVGDVVKHLEKSKDDLTWVIQHLGAITPGIVGLKAATAAGRRIVHFFQDTGGKSKTRFDIGDMSDGTLRCLAVLLALRQRPAPAIVCLDEIEDSIHPGALSVLLDAVAASVDRSQILLTSHSPEALSHPAVTAPRVRVVEWREGRSEVFRLSRGAEEMSRPPRSVGKLLRSNALFTSDEPERVEGDFFEGR